MKINRGSEWNQWDLHIHTPNTKLNDHFRDSEGNKVNQSENEKIWIDYCEMLNNSEIKCFGITDYFSVDNYLYLKNNRKRFGLNDDIILFPNIELRVSGLVTKNKSSVHNHVNVHVIFADTVSESQLSNFLSMLTVNMGDGSIKNFKEHLNELLKSGKFINVPDYSCIKRALTSSLTNNYKEFSLIMIPNGDDGLANTMGTNYNANFDFMKNEVDIIQTINSKDITYYLNDAKNVYGKEYPCVSGSDAHGEEGFLNYDKAKSTWIKAEPTFSGLKSIVHEPKSRVKIRELNPTNLKVDSRIISHIKLPKEDFDNKKIYFNDDMNVIIGGRSSGKSMLLSIIGMKSASISEVKGGNKSYNNLIESKMNDTKLYLKDGSLIDKNLNIEFFYQDKLQEIARNDEERNNFISEILPELSSVNQINNTLLTKKNNLDFSKIIELKDNLKQFKKEYQELQDIDTIISNKANFEGSIAKISMKFTDDEESLITEKTKELSNFELDVEKKDQKIKQLSEIIENPIIKLNDKLSKENRDLLIERIPYLNEEIDKLNKEYKEYIMNSRDVLEKEMRQLNESILSIKKMPIMEKYEESKRQTPELEELNTKLIKEESKLEKRKQLSEDINTISESLENTIAIFLNKIKWDNFKKEINILSENKLSIKYVISIKESILIEILKENFKVNLTIFKESVSGIFKDINNIEEYSQNFEDDFKESLKKLILCDEEKIYKSNSNLEKILSDLVRLNFIMKDFKIEYENQNFDRMSEGKKAFVLLLIKLKIGEQDCPILIDQPEDNLDNRSIAKDLVEYLKDEKVKRQIFIVSHNANVAIGTDSENIIIANENDEENPNPNGVTYYYKNGSLEDENIKREVCLILEGGLEAFRARESRYNFDSIEMNRVN